MDLCRSDQSALGIDKTIIESFNSPYLKQEAKKENKVAKSSDNCIAGEEGRKHKLRESGVEGGPFNTVSRDIIYGKLLGVSLNFSD